MYAVRTTLLALLLAATPALANTTAEAHPLPPGISWVQGDVDAAFAAAKAANKPVFLYWGAGWCPPCNQVKATIFNQQGFIERSKFFVPVYLDGDSPSAQKWGEKFKVVGYPTMILFRPDGTEVMRLPGEAEADRYMRALSLGMNAIHPIAQTLATALKGDKVSADEWQMLADYSWDTDEAQLVPPARLALTLQTLTRNVPAELPGTALRLQLKAVVAAATAQVPQQIDKAGSKVAIDKVLADSKLSREDFDIVVNFPTDVTSYLTKADSDDRKALVAAWDKALAALSADGTISTADRMSAVIGRVSLAQLDAPKDAKLPDTLLKAVRDQVADADA
ncbi:MAG: thioredoxin family protein, partial [Burkholderiales bacterium]|nr:thioredoxin family protein [Burkholderiales bacterium]